MAVLVADGTTPTDDGALYLYERGKGGRLVPRREAEAARAPGRLHWETRLQVADRQWSIAFQPTPTYVPASRAWQAWGVLAGSLLLTALLGAYVHGAVVRAARVRQLVAARTVELSASNTALAGQTAQMDALRGMTEEIARELDLPALLSLIIRRAAGLVGAPAGVILLWDETNSVLVPRAWVGFEAWIADVRLRLGEAAAGLAAQRRQGMVVNDLRSLPGSEVFLERMAVSAVIVEPLLYRDRLVGVLAVNDAGLGRRFTEPDRRLLALFAAPAAIAIENARLHETTSHRARQLATLNELARRLTTVLEPGAVAREILSATRLLIPDVAGRLWEQVEGEDVLRPVASVGLRDPEGGLVQTLRSGEGLVGLAAATREPVIIRDLATDPRVINKAWAAPEGLVSSIVVPLVHGDRFYGALAMVTRAPHDFPDEEVAVLSSFAAQAAGALANARAHSAAVRRGGELGALLRATRTVMAGLDLQGTLRRIVEEAAHIAGTPHVKVLVVDREARCLRVGAVSGGAVPSGFQVPLGRSYSGRVAATGEPLFVGDTPSDPENLLAARDREAGIVTYLGLPIKFGEEVLGVLTFNTEHPHEYGADQLAFLASFADQAAIAIHNARLHEDLEERAVRLRSLAPLNAQLISSSLDMDEVLREIAKAASRLNGGAGGLLLVRRRELADPGVSAPRRMNP